MPTAYTNIDKPTDATYTGVSTSGRQTYDEPLLSYDDSAVYYDSIDENAYSNISKPIMIASTSLVDSYSESNRNTQYIGQSFTNVSSQKLTSCIFYLIKNGSPTGNAYAELWSETHSTNYGVDSIPNILLATSEAFDVSNLTTSFTLVTFNFIGSNVKTLNSNTYYVIIFKFDGGDATNNVKVGADNSSPLHSGNLTYSDYAVSWLSLSTNDICFYVYGTTYTSYYTNINKPIT